MVAACVAGLVVGSVGWVSAGAGSGPGPSPDAAPVTTVAPPPGQLVFADEFDSDALDGTKWSTCHWWNDNGCTIITNDELEWYVPEQVGLADGHLNLTVDRRGIDGTNGNRYEYVSGMISSGPRVFQGPSSFSFTYGTIEARVFAPRGNGHWAAIWLLAASSNHVPEIDIVEIVGNDPNEMIMSFHPADETSERVSNQIRLSDEELGDGWVDVRVDWTPGAIVWSINGVEQARVEGADVPAEPMYVIANLAEGGTLPGPPSADTVFPATFQVDYIRVWQEAP